jgi:GAF domain
MAGTRLRSLNAAGSIMPILPPRFALFELGLFLVIILLEWLWEPFPNLSRATPHPYWVPVLLLSLQYGTVSGLLAAILAIGGSVMIGLPEPDIGESYFAYLVRVWAEPVLWLIVALLLGSFRMRQIESRDDMLREVDDLQTRSVALVDYATNLKARCDRLERQLSASAKPQAVQLLDELGTLGHRPTAASAESLEALDRVLDIAFPGAQASLFVVESGGLRLVHRHAWPATASWRTEIDGNTLLSRSIINEKRGLSILITSDEPCLGGEGLFAVPVLAHGAATIGALKVEALPARLIDDQTLARLAAIGSHLEPLLFAMASQSGSRGSGDDKPAATALPRFRWNPFRRSDVKEEIGGNVDAVAVGIRHSTNRP